MFEVNSDEDRENVRYAAHVLIICEMTRSEVCLKYLMDGRMRTIISETINHDPALRSELGDIMDRTSIGAHTLGDLLANTTYLEEHRHNNGD